MTYEENVRAILESNFAGFKEDVIDVACRRICELQSKGKWIPCSERLPEKEQKIYLVTIDYGDGLSCVAPRFFFNEEIGWNDAEEYITAWMPIPKPYEKERDGK